MSYLVASVEIIRLGAGNDVFMVVRMDKLISGAGREKTKPDLKIATTDMILRVSFGLEALRRRKYLTPRVI